MIDSLKKASLAWKKAKEIAIKEVKADNSILETAEKIEAEIKKYADIAFPVNISLNENAAHFTPNSNCKLFFKENDIVKIDIGTHYNGYIVDSAFTIDLSKQHSDLLNASKNALENAIKYIKKESSNSTFAEIGEIIESTIESYGFKSIRNLTGHSLAQYKIHAGKAVFNIRNNNKNCLGNGHYAIEPFASTGSGIVINTNRVGIYFAKRHNSRIPLGKKILKEIEHRKDLPFAERWIAKDLNYEKKEFVLRRLIKEGSIAPAPELKDSKNGLVSQYEKNVLIKEDRVFIFPE